MLLFEQFGVVHTKGSSHGPSRIIRLVYDTPDYVQLARSAYAIWYKLEAESGEVLLRTIGGLDIGVPDALMLDSIRTTYEALDIPFETLDRDEIVRRYPKFQLPEETIAYYQPDYGLLDADRCGATMANLARRHGAQVHEHEQVLQITPLSDGVEVLTNAGTYRVARLILSAGSWIGPLLETPGNQLPLTASKEMIAYFQPPDPEAYTPERFPIFIHRFPNTTTLGSGFSLFGHAGFKMIFDRTGPEVEPQRPGPRGIAGSTRIADELCRQRLAVVGDSGARVGDMPLHHDPGRALRDRFSSRIPADRDCLALFRSRF